MFAADYGFAGTEKLLNQFDGSLFIAVEVACTIFKFIYLFFKKISTSLGMLVNGEMTPRFNPHFQINLYDPKKGFDQPVLR